MTTANALYQRTWRNKKSPTAVRNHLLRKARGRALERLAKLHADEFGALIDEERGALGLPPKGTTSHTDLPRTSA